MSSEYSQKKYTELEQTKKPLNNFNFFDNSEADDKFQPIKDINIYQFVLEFPDSSIKNLTELLLDKAERQRDYISQSILLSKSNSDEEKFAPLKQFISDIKEKVIEIYFAYHFIKSYQYGGIEHATKHRDQYFISLCRSSLNKDRSIIDTASYLVVWLTSDDVFLKALPKFPVSKINSDEIDAAKIFFIESLIKSNTYTLRVGRKSDLEKTKKEILESNFSPQSKVKKLSGCFIKNSEVTVSQLKSFHDMISSVYEYHFKNSVDKKIPPLDDYSSCVTSKSTYKVTKINPNTVPERLKIFDHKNSFFDFFKKPFSLNPASVIKRFEIAQSGISIFLSNIDQDIQTVLDAYKVDKDEYQLSISGEECKIEINNHKKIIDYLASTGVDARETYEFYGLDYDTVCVAFDITPDDKSINWASI